MNGNSLGEQTPEWRGAFLDAANWFAGATVRASGSLDDPGLGEWTVRDLIGHTTRALSTVESYLTDDTQEPLGLQTPVEYFVAALRADPAQIAARGRAAGLALGADPANAVAAQVARARERVVAAADLARVRTPFGTMTLADYLPTRTFELVVHTGDLFRALGEPVTSPDRSTRSALRLAADLASERGHGAAVLALLTGRMPVGDGFTVL